MIDVSEDDQVRRQLIRGTRAVHDADLIKSTRGNEGIVALVHY